MAIGRSTWMTAGNSLKYTTINSKLLKYQAMDAPIVPTLCEAVGDYLGKTLTPEVASQLCASVASRCYPGPVDTRMVFPKRVGSYVLRCARLIEEVEQLKELHLQHWRETETHRHTVPFAPDYARAIDLEAQGRYLLVVAEHTRTQQIVGNYSIYLARSMHTQLLMATEDTLFVAKEHRRGALGIRMIQYVEQALITLGASELNVSVKRVNDVGPMIERMGYAPVATQYNKQLSGGGHVLS